MIAFDRAVENAAKAICEYEHKEHGVVSINAAWAAWHASFESLASAALRAALQSLAEDEQVVEMVRQAITEADQVFAAPCMMLKTEEGEAYAKAALAALAEMGREG